MYFARTAVLPDIPLQQTQPPEKQQRIESENNRTFAIQAIYFIWWLNQTVQFFFRTFGLTKILIVRLFHEYNCVKTHPLAPMIIAQLYRQNTNATKAPQKSSYMKKIKLVLYNDGMHRKIEFNNLKKSLYFMDMLTLRRAFFV